MARIGQTVRQLVRRAAPDLRETVKWNNPFWVGRRDVACLMIYPDHLNLGILRGAELVGKFPELEGTGKGMRHLKIRTLADARRNVLTEILRAAVRLDSGAK